MQVPVVNVVHVALVASPRGAPVANRIWCVRTFDLELGQARSQNGNSGTRGWLPYSQAARTYA